MYNLFDLFHSKSNDDDDDDNRYTVTKDSDVTKFDSISDRHVVGQVCIVTERR